MAPFLADQHIDIPNKDLLSWMFDAQNYDVDKPVSMFQLPVDNGRVNLTRSTLMLQIPSAPYPRDKQKAS
jgi:hypothetical protein